MPGRKLRYGANNLSEPPVSPFQGPGVQGFAQQGPGLWDVEICGERNEARLVRDGSRATFLGNSEAPLDPYLPNKCGPYNHLLNR